MQNTSFLKSKNEPILRAASAVFDSATVQRLPKIEGYPRHSSRLGIGEKNLAKPKVAWRRSERARASPLKSIFLKNIFPCTLASGEMLPVVATLLPKMLPFKSLTSNDVTDVAIFPTSYINNAYPSSIFHFPSSRLCFG
jgi:hypothetical protein